MRFLLVATVCALATACSHPLDVAGRGDIKSSTGANDCALENAPCANYVGGEYNVTYTGIPRSGWNFVGWENCGTQYPNCSFNIPASVVQQYWSKTMPPLRAKFAEIQLQPLNDTGLTYGANVNGSHNAGCTGVAVEQQDCSHGRDVTDNDPSDGADGFSYTKLASNGAELPANATEWACVRDNVTGLIWEMKTDDGGIHDKDNMYRWGGKTAQGSGFGQYFSDWDVLVDGSNNAALCGFSDWRVPAIFELESIVDFGRYDPAIDTDWFPNTVGMDYWSSMPAVSFAVFPISIPVHFGEGDTRGARVRSDSYRVRLVRGGL